MRDIVTVNIEGLDKAEVLKALYDNSRYQGISFLSCDKDELNLDTARELLRDCTYFDYLFGKVMKIDLSSDKEFIPRMYDRDNGEGAAQRAVDGLRSAYPKKIWEESINISDSEKLGDSCITLKGLLHRFEEEGSLTQELYTSIETAVRVMRNLQGFVELRNN